MGNPTTVFISYSTQDRDLARRLHDALKTRGAGVFQFEEAALPGHPAWSQVANAIKKSDWFLVLVTNASMNSKPVRQEVELAFHAHVNSEVDRPYLVPVMVENASKLDLLDFQTELAFSNYDEGLRRLLDLMQLGIEPSKQTGRPGPLQATLVASPSGARVGEPVYWTAVIENCSPEAILGVTARLGGQQVGGPVDLPPGDSVQFETKISYQAVGSKKRQLLAAGRDGSGALVRAAAERALQVRKAPRIKKKPAEPQRSQPLAGPLKSPTEIFDEQKALTALLERLRDRIGGEPLPTTRDLPEFALTVGLGLALMIGSYFLSAPVVGFFRSLRGEWAAFLPDMVAFACHKVGGSWVPVVVGLIAAFFLSRVGRLNSEDASHLPRRGARATLSSVGVAAVVAVLWSYLFSRSIGAGPLVWFMTGFVGVAAAGVMMGMILEDH